LLIGALGTEGYGVVTLMASVVGYFGIIDINLSAGSIKYLAENHASGERQRFSETFWFGMMFYGFLGVVGALSILLFSRQLVDYFFELSTISRDSTVLALQISALGFALSQVQNYLLIVPQALQYYNRSAQSEAFFGILINILSVVVALMGGGIVGVMAARVSVSALNALYLVWLIRQFDIDLSFRWPGKEIRSALTSFSAYSYLSKIASTFHQHGDKLIVGAIAGPVALTFYTVPVTLAGRILGLTYRLSSVIYPKASELAASKRMAELRPLYLTATRHISYINLAALGVIVLAGDEFLRRWVGEAFIPQGYPVLVLMTFALLVDSLTNIPSMVNDALGHPKVTGGFALSRGILGIALVYLGVANFGIIGAAAAHLIGAVILTLLFLLYVHGRTIPITFSESIRKGWGPSFAIGLLIFGFMILFKWFIPTGLFSTVAVVLMSLLTLGLAGLAFIVSSEERAALLKVVQRFHN
jgi:O-antigen/teichoic acid export membrane protein